MDCQRKIVYRDSFQDLIERYIQDYGRALLEDIPLQKAFVRKFNDLAD